MDKSGWWMAVCDGERGAGVVAWAEPADESPGGVAREPQALDRGQPQWLTRRVQPFKLGIARHVLLQGGRAEC